MLCQMISVFCCWDLIFKKEASKAENQSMMDTVYLNVGT